MAVCSAFRLLVLSLPPQTFSFGQFVNMFNLHVKLHVTVCRYKATYCSIKEGNYFRCMSVALKLTFTLDFNITYALYVLSIV